MSCSRRKHQVAGPYCATIVDLIEPALERHHCAAQEPVVRLRPLLPVADPIDLAAKELVYRQFRIVKSRQDVKAGIDSLDDSNKRPSQPGMANDCLVIAAVNAFGASPEILYRRSAITAERFSFLHNAEFAGIEREMRDDELA